MEPLLFILTLAFFAVSVFMLARSRGMRSYDAAYTGTAVVFGFLVLQSVLLTRLGIHHLWITSAFFLGATLVVVTVKRASRHPSHEFPSAIDVTDRWEYALFSVALLVAFFHALFPTYYMLGGRDPGLYFMYAVVIGKTGGLELMTAANLVAGSGFERFIHPLYPGLYDPVSRGFDSDPTLYFAQFHHAFSAFSAILYQLAGIEGVVRTNAVISFFALWSFGEVIRRLCGARLAVVGILFLGLNVAFVWNARTTLTEMMSLAAVFAGLAFLITALEKENRYWQAALAGALLSISVFSRIDGVLVSGLLLGLIFLYEKNDISTRRVLLIALGTYLVLSVVALLDAWLNSRGYYQDLWVIGSARNLIVGHALCMVLAISILLARGTRAWTWSEGQLANRWSSVTKLIALGCAALFVFLYLVYPDRDPKDFGHRAFTEMAWYVSLALFVAAPFALWTTARRRDHRISFILISFFLAAVILFSVNPAISPDHIWASRRWVPLAIPGLVLAFVVWVSVVEKRLGLLLIIAVSVVYATTSYPYAKQFYFTSILDGYKESYDEAAHDLKSVIQSDDALVFSKDGWTASILRYVYELPVVLLNGRGATKLLTSPLPHDREIYFLGNASLQSSFPALTNSRVCGKFLKMVVGQRPDALYDRCYSLYAYRIESTDSEDEIKPVIMPVTADLFATKVGNWETAGIASKGDKGWLLYGPYTSLSPGRYRVTWQGRFDCEKLASELVFQVAADVGRSILANSENHDFGAICAVRNGKTDVSLEFDAKEFLIDVEYRVHTAPAIDATIENVRLEKQATEVPE